MTAGKTYIQMDANTDGQRSADSGGARRRRAEMVNYRVKGDMYIVDRLF